MFLNIIVLRTLTHPSSTLFKRKKLKQRVNTSRIFSRNHNKTRDNLLFKVTHIMMILKRRTCYDIYKLIMSTDNLFINNLGLATNISASTLRHSTPKFSFPHASRFIKERNLNNPSTIDLKSTTTSRSTTMGIGNKILFQWQFQQKNAQQVPSPDKYDVAKIAGKDALRKSFGLGFDVYAK